VVAAYNEEQVIETKLRNCLAIDYPPDRLTFVFVSDSTDRTNEILLRHQSERVRVRVLPQRRGKVNALAEAFQLCDGEILVLSDANTYYRPDSIRKLVRHFEDPAIGLVTGDVRILATDKPFGTGEGMYYRYERALQEMESAFWSTVAIDGAMYALRRIHLEPPTSGMIADDFVTGMNVGRRGLRIIYDRDAIAEENPTPGDGQEFARKVRVVAYAVQSLLRNEGVPGFSQISLLWAYGSHKLLRWLVPVFLCIALLSNVAAAVLSPFWLALLALQAVFYSLGAVAWRYPQAGSFIFRVPYYFVMVNAAALLGLWRGVRGKQKPVWLRTERLVQE
jgi:cellulose synthase/poly-beta-1,6-N-acetylglucosamine synthase-like glycosyltransferase